MPRTISIVIHQTNPTAGAIAHNCQKMHAAIQRAKNELQADLILFPDMALTGYPLKDLLWRPEIHPHIQAALASLQQISAIHVVFSLPILVQNCWHKQVVVLYNGQIIARCAQQDFSPTDDPLDECRYFSPGAERGCLLPLHGMTAALLCGRDLDQPQYWADLQAQGAQVILGLQAKIFDGDPHDRYHDVLSSRCQQYGLALIYANLVGGQDDVIFAGGSAAFTPAHGLCRSLPACDETTLACHLTPGSQPRLTCPTPAGAEQAMPSLRPVALLYQMLVLSIRDYAHKNGFRRALVSVSGGIDSALTLVLAVDALGKEQVETCYLPSQHSSALSAKIVKAQTQLLGVPCSIIPIDKIVAAYLDFFPPHLEPKQYNYLLANLQARCRANIVMTISNYKQLLVLATGNKSECSVGYATLYGDLAGGFAPLRDVSKTWVYHLAHYRNSVAYAIPQDAIDRPPTAELYPGQLDSNDLLPYELLDPILYRFLEQNHSTVEIAADATDRSADLRRIFRLIKTNEYKRHQAPVGPKVTHRAFGNDIRWPITSGLDFSTDDYTK